MRTRTQTEGRLVSPHPSSHVRKRRPAAWTYGPPQTSSGTPCGADREHALIGSPTHYRFPLTHRHPRFQT
eukprot:6465326-Alexandrium_andersonii.AAC.1